MKTVQFTQSFKVTKNSPIADQIGVKRDTANYAINTIEAVDVPELISEHVAVILNAALETYAKKQFAANTTNWDFVPAIDAITIANVYSDLTAVNARGSRTLTKESLADFAAYYIKLAVEFLGKTEQSASNGAAVINLRLTPLLGNPKALEVFAVNLAGIAEIESFDSSYLPVLEALLEIISNAMEAELITADAL